MDFQRGVILIDSYTDNWGPFEFDCAQALPDGDPIQTAVVKSRLQSTKTDTTAALIEPNSTSITGAVISVRLQYPGYLLTGLHELLFELVLASGAKPTRLIFRPVSVF